MITQQSTKRVLKKLSALRATLSDEEQQILDGFVVGSADEIHAHQLNERITTGAEAGPDEMHAHQLNERIIFDNEREEYRIVN